MSEQTNLATAAAVFHDPRILAMARRLEQLYREEEVRGCFSLGREIISIEGDIAENPATSLSEAAVQAMLAAALVERLREDIVEDTDAVLRRLECLVRSVLSALVRETGVDLREYGGERYAPSYTDPFRKGSFFN